MPSFPVALVDGVRGVLADPEGFGYIGIKDASGRIRGHSARLIVIDQRRKKVMVRCSRAAAEDVARHSPRGLRMIERPTNVDHTKYSSLKEARNHSESCTTECPEHICTFTVQLTV